jgi:hypothetical protein
VSYYLRKNPGSNPPKPPPVPRVPEVSKGGTTSSGGAGQLASDLRVLPLPKPPIRAIPFLRMILCMKSRQAKGKGDSDAGHQTPEPSQ